MTSEILTALLAIGTSISFTLWIRWYDNNNKEKELNEKFKLYKGYAEEFLEICIMGYNNKNFKYYDNVYTLDQLEIEIICKPSNLKISSLDKTELLPMFTLGFLSSKYMLDDKDLHLLRYILDNMYEKSKWFRKASLPSININFSEFNIQDNEENILSFLYISCFIMLTKNTDKNKLETLLTKLKHDEFDDRIRKIIKKGVQE